MTYSLIIPIFNEAHTLNTLLKKLDRLDNKIEIIIVDDGSSDRTDTIIKKHNKVKIITNRSNLGKGASIKKGVHSATNQNIILIDGDLEIDIDCIPKLIEIFEKNNKGVLVGIRWGGNSNFKFEINTLGNFFINGLFNYLYNSRLNDVLCCVKILNTNLFKSLNIQSKGFSIEVETMAKVISRGLIIEEVNIDYHRRTTEEGKKLKISDGWKIIWTMIVLKFYSSLKN